jgi:hypothetical protein
LTDLRTNLSLKSVEKNESSFKSDENSRQHEAQSTAREGEEKVWGGVQYETVGFVMLTVFSVRCGLLANKHLAI